MGWWVGGCTLDYNVSSVPFLSYEIEIGDDQDKNINSLQSQIFQPKLHQIKHVGGVSESS